MQSLTTMTLAALALGGATFAADVAWSEPRGCRERTVSIYFEQDAAGVSNTSREIVERVAAEARSCSGARVIAQAPAGVLADQRAETLSKAFAEKGVDLVMVAPTAANSGDTIANRAAIIRISATGHHIS